MPYQVVLLETGVTRSRDKRRIQLIIAERGTGFTLWSDIIDNLSNYEVADTTFHTMRQSTDHRNIIGLSFDSPQAADQFFGYVDALTSDPANIRLSAPKRSSRATAFLRFFKAKNQSANDGSKKHPPRKSDISTPCFFQHVTNVDMSDRGKLFSLQNLVPQ